MERISICMNGEWDFMPVYGSKACLDLPECRLYEKTKIRVPSSWRYMTSESGKSFGKIDSFEPFNLFGYPEKWNDAETAIYRRIFKVPIPLLQGLLSLRFDGIMPTSRIYLNGKVIADWDESFLPLKVDISDVVTSGENELIVICSNFEEVEISSGERKSLGLQGSWYGKIGRGIWQDVFLEHSARTYIENLFVKTSVRNSHISFEISVENLPNDTREVSVRISIIDKGKIIQNFSSSRIRLKEEKKQLIHIDEKLTGLKLWSPDCPYLYEIQCELVENNYTIDTKKIHYGFRELWIDKDQFLLNGVRINLRGDSWHFQGAIQQTKEFALNWFKMCKEKGLNFVRLHAQPYPELYLDVADEIGMLIIDETAIYGSSKAMPANHPVYIARCKKHVERLVLRDRNHPSVVIWSLQNEMRWVDGREDYKFHIPSIMEVCRSFDGTRPIILEGDNRLLTKEACDIESYHYNIDGTIGQWDRARPLVFGEHGGWWYMCPQNSSAYIGLKAYENSDFCAQGFALKEKIYVEYARMKEVSGISSFNFAHYMMKSMPDDDIYLNWDTLDTPGCKPLMIPKQSLTLNNGYLRNNSAYHPNSAMHILESCYKPVTIIPMEYNTSFYDEIEIVRNFYVYNDTEVKHSCKIDVQIRLKDESVIFHRSYDITQEPGESKRIKIQFITPKVDEKTTIQLVAFLYHELIEKHLLIKTYQVFPASIKVRQLDTKKRKAIYFGGDRDFRIIQKLLPAIDRAECINQIGTGLYQIFILGSNLRESAEKHQDVLAEYTSNGGVLVQMEQFQFAPGDISLEKQSFFSAHMSDLEHDIVKNLCDDDLRFWKPYIIEEKPENIILQSFRKPVFGDYKMVLECSAGDFGDGGDFWTPLLELANKKGTAILNQVEIMNHFEDVPQACVLLRNILQYACNLEPRMKTKIGIWTNENSEVHQLANGIGMDFDLIRETSDFLHYRNLVVDLENVHDNVITELTRYVNEGGCLFVPALKADAVSSLKKIINTPVKLTNAPTYHLRKNISSILLRGISIVDLFRFEKVPFSPRLVENIPICDNSIEIAGADNMLVSVTGTPWYDYFVGCHSEEYSKIALVEINRTNAAGSLPYVVRKQVGKGSVIVSQISINLSVEKNIRIYTRLMANMDVLIDNRAFSYTKQHSDHSIGCLMSLPHGEHNDHERVLTYFADKDYTLNNLGEGLYGWMKKIEKDPIDGFFRIADSIGKRYFLTCFVENIEGLFAKEAQTDTLECRMDLDINCSFQLWLNGIMVHNYIKSSLGISRVVIKKIRLAKNLNRFVISTGIGDEDVQLRPVFIDNQLNYLQTLKYLMTIDEIDPK